MNKQDTLTALNIERTFTASKEKLFEAITKPELMNQWFYGMETGYAKVDQDFRVGGKYTIHMLSPGGEKSNCGEGESHAPYGEYLEIDPPNRVVFTWTAEGFVESSKVSINLESISGGTKLILKHELPADMLLPHTEGWTNCLSHLIKLMAE